MIFGAYIRGYYFQASAADVGIASVLLYKQALSSGMRDVAIGDFKAFPVVPKKAALA